MYNPLFGKSHITFTEKVAETLVEAGHRVVRLFESPLLRESIFQVMLSPVLEPQHANKYDKPRENLTVRLRLKM